MPAMTRGPLPARVYWLRRTMVLGVAVLLVVGIARLLGGGSDASSDPDQAARLSAETPESSATSATSSAPTTPVTSTGATGRPGKDKPGKQETSEAPLAQPDGACSNEDVAVTPEVENAVGGRDVKIVLQLRTLESEACTWRVSADTLTVSITSGEDDIWSSRDCPHSIPVRDVIVRQAVTTSVDVIWKSARRSGEQCYLRTEWARLGWYHVTTAALGGDPSDLQFELTEPSPVTVTETASPTNSPGSSPSGRPVVPSGSAGSSPGKSPGKSPSGAVEPD